MSGESAHLQWMKPQLLTSIQLLTIILNGIWLQISALNINRIGWNKQEAETIKCAHEPSSQLKFTLILWSWDCRGYEHISKESPKITIPNLVLTFFFLLLYQTHHKNTWSPITSFEIYMASGVFKMDLFWVYRGQHGKLHSQASKDNKRATTKGESSQSKALIDKQMPAAASFWVDRLIWVWNYSLIFGLFELYLMELLDMG